MQPVSFGRHAPAVRTIVHLSDTHLLAGDRPLGGAYDATGGVTAPVGIVERTGIRPDAIVVTGDLTDLGEPAAYRRLRELVEPMAAQLDAQRALVADSQRSYTLADARYRTGLDGYLQSLDAQRSLYAAQQDLIALQQQEAGNRVTLFKVLGGGADAR